MKFEELFEQMDKVKNAFEKAGKKFDCDEVEMVFKTDDGDIIPIGCVEGGYAPDEKTNLLIFSSGKDELMKLLEKMLFGEPQTVNAEDIDVGEKLSFDEVFNDNDH